MKKHRVIGLAIAMSLALALVLVVRAVDRGTTFVTENGVKVTEKGGIRTTVAMDDTTEYTVVYDRGRNTISMTERDLETGAVKGSAVTDIDSFDQSAPEPTMPQEPSSDFVERKG